MSYKHLGSDYEHGLDIGSPVMVSKLYDSWHAAQHTQVIDVGGMTIGGKVESTPHMKPNLPYTQISPYFQIQLSPNWETGDYVVAPILNTTTQLSWQQLEIPPTKRFEQVVREERVIPEQFLTPITPFPEGTMNNLQLEIKRFEFKAKNDAGGWCNLRLYAHFSPNAEKRALQLLDIMQPNALENGFNPDIPLILVLSEVMGTKCHEEGDNYQYYANIGRTVINGLEQALTEAGVICQYMLGRQWDKVYTHLPTREIGAALGTREEDFDLIETQAPNIEKTTLTRAYPRHRYGSVQFVPSSRQYLEAAIGCKFAPVLTPYNSEDVNG